MTPSGGPAVAQVSVSWALGPAAGWCHGGPSPEGGLLGFTAGRGRGSAGHLWRGGRLPAPCEDTPLCSDSPGEAAAVGPRGGLSPQRGQTPLSSTYCPLSKPGQVSPRDRRPCSASRHSPQSPSSTVPGGQTYFTDTRPGDVTKTRVLRDGDIRKNAKQLNARWPGTPDNKRA